MPENWQWQFIHTVNKNLIKLYTLGIIVVILLIQTIRLDLVFGAEP